MLAVEKWAEGKFKPMAMLSQLLAASAENCWEVIQLGRKAQPLPLEIPSGELIRQSLDLYRKPLQLEGFLLHLVSAPEEPEKRHQTVQQWEESRPILVADFSQCLKQAFLYGIPEWAIQRGQRWLSCFYRRFHLPMLERILKNDCGTVPENVREWFAAPEMAFFLKVTMRAWLEYQETPWDLFRKACAGDIDALEKLMRLDSEVDKDPQLQVVVFALKASNPERYRMLQRARFEGCKKRITLEDVKFLLGGLLMKWSHQWEDLLTGRWWLDFLERRTPEWQRSLHHKWFKEMRRKADRKSAHCWQRAPDIQKLFHAVAQDQGRGPIDHEMNQEPESVAKRIWRNSKPWPDLLKTDNLRVA